MKRAIFNPGLAFLLVLSAGVPSIALSASPDSSTKINSSKQTITADGSVRSGDGSVKQGDGSVRHGDGSVKVGDGSVRIAENVTTTSAAASNAKAKH